MSFEINTLALATFLKTEPLNFCAFNHLRGFENLVTQICPRWNRVADWLREAEGYSRAA